MIQQRVFSFGGGVQSHAVMILTSQGKLRYDAFVFANVGDDSENPATLQYLERVTKPWASEHDIDLVEIRKNTRPGKPATLYQHLVAQNRSIAIPVRLSNGAPGRRGCTTDWKIRVIARWLKQHGANAETPAAVGLGISAEESHRARTDSGIAWETLEYPLLDLHLTRLDCYRIIADAGLPTPPKSSCWFCPYKRTREWHDMRKTDPETFERACALERRINEKRGAIGRDVVHLHRSMLPLAEAIDGQQMALDDNLELCESGFCYV